MKKCLVNWVQQKSKLAKIFLSSLDDRNIIRAFVIYVILSTAFVLSVPVNAFVSSIVIIINGILGFIILALESENENYDEWFDKLIELCREDSNGSQFSISKRKNRIHFLNGKTPREVYRENYKNIF